MLSSSWPLSARDLFLFVFCLFIGSPLFAQAQSLGRDFDSVNGNVQFNSNVLSSSTPRKPLSYETEPTSYSRIDGIPNSFSENHRKWESVLDSPSVDFPEEREIEASMLIKYLNDLGLPVVLDQSAIDDSLSKDTPINLPLRGSRLGDRLRVVFREHNATWTFDGNVIRIISMDHANEAENFMLVNYEISSLPTPYQSVDDTQPLIQTITTAIEPDNWNFTQGEQSITPFFINRKVILVVNANYDTHQKIRQFFRSITQFSNSPNNVVFISGPSPVFNANRIAFSGPSPVFNTNRFSVSGPSTAVAIPKRPTKAGITLPGSNSDNNGSFGGGGLGGGGSGLGGGFSVSSSIK
jgi:hypothetical protein